MADQARSRKEVLKTMLSREFKIRRDEYARMRRELQGETGEKVVTATMILEEEQPFFERDRSIKTTVRVREPQEEVVTILAADLERFRTALARNEEGTYGDCFECGEEIGLARLAALPFAVRCKKCEDERDAAKAAYLVAERKANRKPEKGKLPL